MVPHRFAGSSISLRRAAHAETNVEKHRCHADSLGEPLNFMNKGMLKLHFAP